MCCPRGPASDGARHDAHLGAAVLGLGLGFGAPRAAEHPTPPPNQPGAVRDARRRPEASEELACRPAPDKSNLLWRPMATRFAPGDASRRRPAEAARPSRLAQPRYTTPRPARPRRSQRVRRCTARCRRRLWSRCRGCCCCRRTSRQRLVTRSSGRRGPARRLGCPPCPRAPRPGAAAMACCQTGVSGARRHQRHRGASRELQQDLGRIQIARCRTRTGRSTR